MRKVVVCTNVSLDGVMQSPARPDEDRRNGFERGGWAAPYAAMTHAGHVFGTSDALLFGRRTYEDFYNVWPKRTDSPFTPWLTGVKKYVASRTLAEPLPWANSALLRDPVADVSALKQQPGKDILVMGSGALVRSLMGTRVIDEFVLLIHPLVLGGGTRLFADAGPFVDLTLASSTTTPTGVVIATYHPQAKAEISEVKTRP
jgi:dihydrofolate reductase